MKDLHKAILMILTCNILAIMIGVFVYDQHFSESKYEQDVQIDYIVYTPVKELHRSKVVKISGDNLAPQYCTGKGTNIVYVIDDSDKYSIFNHRPRVKIYNGTDYCEVISIKPLHSQN